ncbi:hypothetical protein EV127DRAFT_57672 [Xylaria flabelliformis]|nr:hypothetical protein EV127DRAFT_57672 [Xylaria flabelliformis]
MSSYAKCLVCFFSQVPLLWPLYVVNYRISLSYTLFSNSGNLPTGTPGLLYSALPIVPTSYIHVTGVLVARTILPLSTFRFFAAVVVDNAEALMLC